MKSLYGLCISKLEQIYALIYYDFPRHPLLVNYSNAYRPREEHKSSELSIMRPHPPSHLSNHAITQKRISNHAITQNKNSNHAKIFDTV